MLPDLSPSADADAVLAEFGLPERAPQEQLRGITRVAATLCGVETAVVNLLSSCFQHQVGAFGFDGGESDVGDSMCARALREPELRYVPDASLEPAFALNPWVDGRMAGVRLYASAPMTLPDGRVLGSLCVFSDRPGELSPAQLSALGDLAGQAVALFEHARLAREAHAVANRAQMLAVDLERSRVRYRQLFDAAPIGMLEADEDSRIVQANGALARLLGHGSPDDLTGLLISELTDPDERSEQAGSLAARVATGTEAWDNDRRLVRRDGTVADTVVSRRVVRGPDGGLRGFIVTVVDVSERAAARRALDFARARAEERETLMRVVLDTISAGVVACDAEGRLTLFNRAARDMHGLDADASLDPAEWAQTYSLFAEDGRTPLAPAEIPLNRALREGSVRDALMVIAPEGLEPRTVRADGAALDGDAGVLGAVVAMADITALRAHARQVAEARDEALAATRAKSAFLAAVSHEIRTPLHGVLGMLELLLAHELDEAQRERAETAHSAGRTLLTLLNDVLDLSKSEARDDRLRLSPLDPRAIAREAADGVRGTASLKGLDVAVEIGAVPEGVEGDPDRLRQILLNLLGNAVKFTDTGGVRLTVDAPAPGHLRFAVADTGPGIDPADADRLFQPFEQGSAGFAKGGTGLGLALCRQLTARMGGTLDLDTGPGGSTFTVILPLRPVALTPAVPAQRQAPAAERAPAGHGAGGAPRVLLVDDNHVNRVVGAALLRHLGAEVTLAEDGTEALDLATATRFDLILMDRQMPGMDGLTATRELRARPGTRDVPVVALTGAGDLDRQECLDAGMDDFLTKPVSGATLGAVLERFAGARST